MMMIFFVCSLAFLSIFFFPFFYFLSFTFSFFFFSRCSSFSLATTDVMF